MTRKEQLQQIIIDSGNENDIKALQLAEEIIFLEEQLQSLRQLPFIKVHPDNPALQKSTPAAKLYKEMLQQYTSSLRLLLRICGELGTDQDEEDSPLRQWARSRIDADSREEDLDT